MAKETNMKKQLFKVIAIATVSLALTACTGNNTPTNVSVESVEISETAITLAVGSTKQLTATVKPDNATNKAVQWSASVDTVEVSAKGLVTAKKVGKSVVTVSALDNGKKATCEVTVEEESVSPKDKYEIDAPVSCIDSYVSYKTTIDPNGGHDEKTSFMDLDQGYSVGYANKINIKPSFTLYDKEDNEVDQDLWAYDFEFEFEVKENDGYVAASENLYEIVDARKAEVKFTEAANGKTFRVRVFPGELTAEQKASVNYRAEYLFNVVNGYNIYEAKELSYLDVRHGVESDYHWGDVAGFTDQWDAFKDANGLDKTLSVQNIILHKNIKVTTDDIPSNVLYNEQEAQAAGLPSIKGSLKDTAHIYTLIQEGEITINGNYFHLDFSEIPLIKRAEGKADMLLNSHTAFFRALNGNLTIKNLNFTGNAEKAIGDEFNKYAGGLIFIKAGSNALNTKLYNVIAKQNFVTLFPEENGTSDEVVCELEKSKLFDNYSSFLYNQGSTITAKDCIFRSCGGPIVVQDHTAVDVDHGGTYEDHIAEGGFDFFRKNGKASNTVFDGCTLDNYLLGEEAWFKQYEGVEAMVPQIRAVSDILYQGSSGAMAYVVDKDGNPVPSAYQGDKLFNLIAVNKSGSVAGATSLPVCGNVTIKNGEALEVFDYSNPNDEVTLIQKALYEQDAALIGALCQKYQVASPEALAGVAAQLAAETGYSDQMYIHGGIRAMNNAGAPVLQTGTNYGYYNGTGFYDVYTKATTGQDVSVGASYFLNASEHVALYYMGMEVVFTLVRAQAQ